MGPEAALPASLASTALSEQRGLPPERVRTRAVAHEVDTLRERPPGVVPPVDVEYKNTTRHELVVLFDPEGIVTEVGYERTEIPSKRVY